MIQSFFGGIGTITINPKKRSARYSVVGINDINNFIVTHFENYPLQSVKKIDFDLWKECVNLIINKKDKTQEGLEQIVAIKSKMNLGLSNLLKKEFPNINCLDRQTYLTNNDRLDPDWVSGFIEGDGSFYIYIRTKTNHVNAALSIGLNIREKPLLIKIQDFFWGMGNVYIYNSRSVVEWKVVKLSQLTSIASHFYSYPLMGLKSYNFIIWREILSLIEIKAQLTSEGLTKIKYLNKQLNKWD